MNKKFILPVTLLGALVISAIVCFRQYYAQQQIITNLFFGGSAESIDRHLQITENIPQNPYSKAYTPSHIYFRKNEQSPWRFHGTGTILVDRPHYMVTAYHVFEKISGQFGYRKITKNEIADQEMIRPILECNYNKENDDTTLCKIDPHGSTFPIITSPESTTSFNQFENGKYRGRTFPHVIRFLTYPDKPIQGLFWIEVKPGVWHVFFKHHVVPGESGTGALIDGFPPDNLLVVLRKTAYMNEDFFKPFGIHAGDELAVGHIIKVK